jgi:hypothetical protein
MHDMEKRECNIRRCPFCGSGDIVEGVPDDGIYSYYCLPCKSFFVVHALLRGPKSTTDPRAIVSLCPVCRGYGMVDSRSASSETSANYSLWETCCGCGGKGWVAPGVTD